MNRTLSRELAHVAVDAEVQGEAEAVLRTAHDRQLTGVKLVLDDGSEVELPSGLSRFFAETVENLAQRGMVSASSMPEQLTTTVAADVLGISRPTLMKLVREGIIDSFKVGTHTRFRRSEVLQLRDARRQQRASAVRALLEAGEAFD